jgi:hypothetical protein
MTITNLQVKTASRKNVTASKVEATEIKAYADYVRDAANKVFGPKVGIDPSMGTKLVDGENVIHIVPPYGSLPKNHKQFIEMLKGFGSVDRTEYDPKFKKGSIKVIMKKGVKSSTDTTASKVKSDAVESAPAQATDVPERQVLRFLQGLEADLYHEARYKQVDISEAQHAVYWITQESSDLESALVAGDIAEAFTKRGWAGWTINVVNRDKYKGRDESPWKKAYSKSEVKSAEITATESNWDAMYHDKSPGLMGDLITLPDSKPLVKKLAAALGLPNDGRKSRKIASLWFSYENGNQLVIAENQNDAFASEEE